MGLGQGALSVTFITSPAHTKNSDSAHTGKSFAKYEMERCSVC